MKYIFLVLFINSLLWALSLDDCGTTDAKCVGKVLLEAMGNSGSSASSVEFYHDDGRCEPAKLITTVRMGDTKTCEKLASLINDDVWGIRLNGKCFNTDDVPFKTACLKYVS